MKAFVAVTDHHWFRFLRQRPELTEVNFWQPSGGRPFRALDVGEPFLFKLHHPEDFIVGGGFFAHWTQLPVSVAWDAFGAKNGAESPAAMRELAARYREAPDAREDYVVGCIVLQDPFFFDERNWIPAPEDFHPNVSFGKGYDLRARDGSALWESVMGRHGVRGSGSQLGIFAEPVLVRSRMGEGTFRVLVTDAYDRRCAVTGEAALPVLEATHVRPVREGGVHQVRNGILLRSDLRRLFDRGYLTITPKHRVRVSPRLAKEFGGGESYAGLDGAEVRLPHVAGDRPEPTLLAWHSESVFRG